MFDSKLKEDFKELVDGLRNAGVLSESSLYFHTTKFDQIMGKYGEGLADKVKRIEYRLDKKDAIMKMLMEHLNLEVHEPDCKPVLRKKAK